MRYSPVRATCIGRESSKTRGLHAAPLIATDVNHVDGGCDTRLLLCMYVLIDADSLVLEMRALPRPIEASGPGPAKCFYSCSSHSSLDLGERDLSFSPSTSSPLKARLSYVAISNVYIHAQRGCVKLSIMHDIGAEVVLADRLRVASARNSTRTSARIWGQ